MCSLTTNSFAEDYVELVHTTKSAERWADNWKRYRGFPNALNYAQPHLLGAYFARSCYYLEEGIKNARLERKLVSLGLSEAERPSNEDELQGIIEEQRKFRNSGSIHPNPPATAFGADRFVETSKSNWGSRSVYTWVDHWNYFSRRPELILQVPTDVLECYFARFARAPVVPEELTACLKSQALFRRRYMGGKV